MYKNNMFGKGMIVYISTDADELHYLKKRPLLIVSDPEPRYNKVLVCTIGSRDRMGIKCSLWNYEHGKSIGNEECSCIHPYNIVTIHLYSISSVVGMIDRHMMDEVDECILYHLGLSKKVPAYYEEVHENYLSVKHNCPSEGVVESCTVRPELANYTSYTNGITKTFKISPTWSSPYDENTIISMLNEISNSDIVDTTNVYTIADTLNQEMKSVVLSFKVSNGALAKALRVDILTAAKVRERLKEESVEVVKLLFNTIIKSEEIELTSFQIVSYIYQEAIQNLPDFTLALNMRSIQSLNNCIKTFANENNIKRYKEWKRSPSTKY